MAEALIDVIEESEANLEEIRAELKDLEDEAKKDDGVIDQNDEEFIEIKDLETLISELEQTVYEKRQEFEANEAEWKGLAGSVSDLMADFLTLKDWGDPNLGPVDDAISEMEEAERNRYYRQAIEAYPPAQEAIDPLMEEYRKQSAAKLDYDKQIADATARVEAVQQAEVTSDDLAAELDQFASDFESMNALTEARDYVEALSQLQDTAGRIPALETRLEELKAAKAEAEKTLAALETRISELEPLAAPFADLAERVQASRTALDEIRKEIETGAFENANGSMENETYNLDTLGGEIEVREAERAEYENELADFTARFDAIKRDGLLNSEIGAVVAELEKNLAAVQSVADGGDYARATEDLRAASQALTDLETLVEEARKRQAEFDAEAGKLKDRLSTARGGDLVNGEIGAALDTLDQALANAQAAADAGDYDPALDGVRTAAQDLTGVEAQLAEQAQLRTRFEETGKVFGPLATAHQETGVPAIVDAAVDVVKRSVQAYNLAAEHEYQDATDQLQALIDELNETDLDFSDLDAAAPSSSAWMLYDWKKGDTPEKVAKDSRLENASAILDFPNNAKIRDFYNQMGGIPTGTKVCVFDPTVKVHKLEVDGKEIYVTDEGMAEVVAQNEKLVGVVKTNFRKVIDNLTVNHETAMDARQMVWWLTEWMTGWDVVEPTKERDKAVASVKALESCGAADIEKFTDQLLTTAKDCEAYRDALKDWLAEMQAELKTWLSSAETVAKAVIVAGLVPVAVPLVPAAVAAGLGSTATGAVTAMGVAATVSVSFDEAKVVNAIVQGVEPPLSQTDVATNALKAGATAGVGAAVFSGAFSLLGPRIASALNSTGILERQATRAIWNSGWVMKLVKLPSGTISEQELQRIVVLALSKVIARFGWAQTFPRVFKPLVDTLDGDMDILKAKTPEAAADAIVAGHLDEKMEDSLFDAFVEDYQKDIEDAIAEEVAKLDTGEQKEEEDAQE